MDPQENSGLDRLGEDLVLLSVSPADGRISTAQAAYDHAPGQGMP
jgi:hypothetical protein